MLRVPRQFLRIKIKDSFKMSQQQNQMPQIDLNQIMQSAQQLANNISPEEKDRISNMNMDQMFDHVTGTVFGAMEKNGQQIDPATKTQMKLLSKNMLGQFMEGMEDENEVENSKIDLGDLEAKSETHKLPKKEEVVEVLDDKEEVLPLRPRGDDVYYNLDVSLEDMYAGKTKKLRVKRERAAGRKTKKESVKIEVPVLKGTRDGQEVRFNREGNEKPGYEAGDIVVTLNQNNHSYFERHGETLYTVKNISLYESYAAGRGDIKIVLKHLDGSYMFLKVDDGIPLHANDGSRKIKGGGMPVFGSKKGEYGDLYIRFNVILPETFEGVDGDKALDVIKQLFPILPGNKDTLVHTDGKTHGFNVGPSDKTRDVVLEEVTEEDKEQIDYEEEDYSEYSDEYSDDSSEDDYSEDSRERRR